MRHTWWIFCDFQAGLLIEEELGYIRSAMGHEDATLDDYAEARDACVDDLMYLPTRDSFGLASVASTSDRLAALQYQFENVKKQMEAETRKAVRLEQKIKVLTQGYQVRTSGFNDGL
jgi:pre-mRNA-splicing factor CDC5/CEF1